jgi:type I restriction enzyme S subunit
MSSEWETAALGETVVFLSGNTPSKSNTDYWGTGTSWISAKDMKSFWVESAEDTLTAAGVEAASRLVEPGTTLLLTRGMTLHHDVPIVRTRFAAAFNQDVKAVVPRSRVLADYVPYLLLGNKPRLRSMVDSAGHGTGRLNSDSLKALQVAIPSIEEQRDIASFFGAIDDRIALLRETNATLEAIAQALFKSWFVDFDPVSAKQEGRAPEGMGEATAALFPDGFEESELGLVPRGWRVAPLGEVVQSAGGGTPDTKDASYWEPAQHFWTTPKDLSGMQAPVLLGTERKLSAKGIAKISSGLLPVGTLLMSSRAPIGYLAMTNAPMAINQGYIAILPDSVLPPLYMLFWCRLNMETIKSHANGSTFMEISKKAFRPLLALVPSIALLAEFVAVASALFERIVENEVQAQTLATLRDTLLPRLISGQLRLPAADALLAEFAA